MVTSKTRYGILYNHALDLRTQHEIGSSSDCLFVSKIVYSEKTVPHVNDVHVT